MVFAWTLFFITVLIFIMPWFKNRIKEEMVSEFPVIAKINGIRTLLQHYYDESRRTGEAAAFGICFHRYFTEANKIELVKDFGEFVLDKESQLVRFETRPGGVPAGIAKKWQMMVH
jgi:hypothetical protein